VRTWRLSGRSHRHRRLRVVVLDKARARPAPRKGPRPKPREVGLAYRLLNSKNPRARDVLDGFYRRGRWVEDVVTCNSVPASICLRQKRYRAAWG
jgi:hypothetical protein